MYKLNILFCTVLKDCVFIKCVPSANIQRTEGGPDRSVSDNQPSSVTLNELAMKAKITGNEGQNNIP